MVKIDFTKKTLQLGRIRVSLTSVSFVSPLGAANTIIFPKDWIKHLDHTPHLTSETYAHQEQTSSVSISPAAQVLGPTLETVCNKDENLRSSRTEMEKTVTDEKNKFKDKIQSLDQKMKGELDMLNRYLNDEKKKPLEEKIFNLTASAAELKKTTKILLEAHNDLSSKIDISSWV